MYQVLIYQWNSLYQVRTFKNYEKALKCFNEYKIKPCFDAFIIKKDAYINSYIIE